MSLPLPPGRPGFRLVGYHPAPRSKMHPDRLVGVYERGPKREEPTA